MNLDNSLLLLLAALASKNQLAEGQKTGHTVAAVPNFVECFSELREANAFSWIVEDKGLCDVSSVFGPAISSCTGAARFNRALAVHGALGSTVKAPYGGTVVQVVDVPNDLDFRVVIEHDFGKYCEFHGHGVDKFYTTYEKLGSVNVAVGDTVSSGDAIGVIGDCIRHCGSSVLMSLRIGASCSLGYANEYLAEHGYPPECNNRGFDPHANGHLLSPFIDEETHFEVHESQCWGPDENGAITVDSLKVTTDCAGADVNRYEVTCGDLFHVIDFNMRESFDPSTKTSIHDPPSGDVPYIEASPYKHDSEMWEQTLIIPDAWYHAGGGDDCCTVDVFDTWGNTEQQVVCGTSRHYISMFAQMRDEIGFAWPTPLSARTQIFSSFGIRNEQDDPESFHNGVDIHGYYGQPIVAVYDGKVVTRKSYTYGGKTIMLEHKFLDETATKLNTECGVGDRIAADTFYTQYQHLANYNVGYGDEVQKGDIIGYMGSTGEAADNKPFLHLELRFGTKCTLKYCTGHSDPAVVAERMTYSCCQFGYEPTIHPFLLFDYIEHDVWFALRDVPLTSTHQDGVVYIHTLSHQASINVVEWIHTSDNGSEFLCSDDSTYDVKASHMKDFSVKHGFYGWQNYQQDPSAPEPRTPFLRGVGHGGIPTSNIQAHMMEWRADAVIPHEWLGSVQEGDHLIVAVTDVWGVTNCGSWSLWEDAVDFGVSHPHGVDPEGHGHSHD